MSYVAVIGLYGVLSRLVIQRTHEIGIRMALGARPEDVLTMFAKWVMRLAAIGIAIGLVSTWGLTRLLTALLYGVSASDPAMPGIVTAVLAASAGLATFLLFWNPIRPRAGSRRTDSARRPSFRNAVACQSMEDASSMWLFLDVALPRCGSSSARSNLSGLSA
jgi:predicted lysophospholipase L1 biosynthesis ABC-type transport system permease subunit